MIKIHKWHRHDIRIARRVPMEPVQLGFEQSRTLLEAYGIPVLGRMIRTLEQAKQAARELGFPVAMKTVSSQIIHKSDLGCVLLGLEDEDALAAGYARLMDNVRAAGVTESMASSSSPWSNPALRCSSAPPRIRASAHDHDRFGWTLR
jgi:Acyl-CoA synthetase (NDP forming)